MIVALVLFAAAPSITVAGDWFDGGGNIVVLPTNVDAQPVALTPGHRSIDDLAALFADACLHGAVGIEAVNAAVATRSWGFHSGDADIGSVSREHLRGWQADDVAVTASHRVWPLAECSVSAEVAAEPRLDDIVSRVSGDVAAAPDRRSAARTANGHKLDGETVRWSPANGRDRHRRIYGSVTKTSPSSWHIVLGLTEESRT